MLLIRLSVEHLQRVCIYLRYIFLDSVSVIVGSRSYLSLHEDGTTTMEILLRYLCETAPNDNVMPFGFVLYDRAIPLLIPLFGRGYGKTRHLPTVLSCVYLGIVTKKTDDCRLI